MIDRILRTALPDWMIARMRRSPVLRRLKRAGRIAVGAARGLKFDPGPSNRAYARGDNELPVQEALSRCLKPGDTLYDIGANVGFFSVIGAKLVGLNGVVYAFEPVPENASCIRRNVALNSLSNVVVTESAVASASGESEMRLAAYSGGAALANVAAPPDAAGVISVTTVSVDDWVFHPGPRPPSVVKIDVEGAEMEVLSGMARTLREIRPTVIYEIDDCDPDLFQKKWDECRALLEDSGYQVERLPDSYPNTDWIVGHAVATHRSKLQ